MDGEIKRNIFATLAELDRALPPERRVGAPYANAPSATGTDLPAKMLAAELEVQGFCITHRIPEEGRVMLNIGWRPRPDGRVFFSGVLELRPTAEGVAGQWMLPGQCGVNHILRRELEQLCLGPGSCLSRAGQKHCLAGITHFAQSGNTAKHDKAWPVQSFQSMYAAGSSSMPSRSKNDPN
jgi:hypothetical protein